MSALFATCPTCGGESMLLHHGSTHRPRGSALEHIEQHPETVDRFWSKVDKSADCWTWTAGKVPSGYGTFCIHDHAYGAHRLSWMLHTGEEIPEGLMVDHKCFTRSCVNPAHLHLVTPKENCENRFAIRARSGYLNVSWNGNTGKWVVCVKHAGKQHYRGPFDDPEEAAEVAKALRLELFTNNLIDRGEAIIRLDEGAA